VFPGTTFFREFLRVALNCTSSFFPNCTDFLILRDRHALSGSGKRSQSCFIYHNQDVQLCFIIVCAVKLTVMKL
jgi:hypothetical protein